VSYPIPPVPTQETQLGFTFFEWFRQVRDRVLNTTTDYQDTSVPITGTWKVRDTVINSNPSEQGAPGSKYVIYGWYCITAGSPGTWVEMRFLTGN
jgi:hypothetical protein